NEASNWFAGCPEGSPGKAYDPTCAAVGIEASILNEEITLLPNPTTGILQIVAKENPDEVVVYSMSGQLLMQCRNSQHMDLSHLTKGIYFISMRWGEQHLIRKVVRE
ncbi:MAG: T9SS type A sorting domain-containing protein, partial [Chitinophagaceae bacterium]|nr:T9SS type A sorting domain-containing protein [Chitinophagaceae bacterium]